MSTESPLSVREALRLSQTNVTADPYEGLRYAKMAYDIAQDPDVRVSDPTAMGEAAAKAGLLTEQIGLPLEASSLWFQKSISALPKGRRGQREKIATYMLEGSTLDLHQIKGLLYHNEDAYDDIKHYAGTTFAKAEDILRVQHLSGDRWDRYGTMLARRRATHEAVFGHTNLAATTAIRGLWRAIRADREGKATEEHREFVKRHLAANASVGLLAASRPFADIPKVKAKRLKLALKLSS